MPPPTDQYHPEQQAVKRGIKRGHQELQASEENEKEIEAIYEDAVCMLCSDELSTFKHTHTSSEGVRLFAMELGNVRRFCLLCKASENTVDTSSKTGSTWIKTDPDLDGYFTLTLSTDSKLALTSTSGLILDSIGGNLFDSKPSLRTFAQRDF